MDTKYLSYIITMAEEQNMTRAADKLFVSQSTLSYYLSKLEREIGTPLFWREKNHLSLTTAGRMYVDTAREIIALKENLYQNIAHLDDNAHIVVSATSQWGLKLFSDIIPGFKSSFPNVTFELSHTEIFFLAKEIIDKKIDFSLVSLSSLRGLQQPLRILRMEELFLAVSAVHPYARSHPENMIPQQDVVSQFYQDTFLLSRKDSANRNLADQLFQKYDTPPHICEVNGLPLTNTMVAQNVGIAFMPLSGITPEYRNTVRYYSFSPKIYRYNVIFHKNNFNFTKPELAFYNAVKNYFPEQDTT